MEVGGAPRIRIQRQQLLELVVLFAGGGRGTVCLGAIEPRRVRTKVEDDEEAVEAVL